MFGPRAQVWTGLVQWRKQQTTGYPEGPGNQPAGNAKSSTHTKEIRVHWEKELVGEVNWYTPEPELLPQAYRRPLVVL